MAPPTRVVVLYGGRSAEHDVSCVSARFVLSQLDRTRYDAVPVGITHDGAWVDARRAIEVMDPAAPSLPSPDTMAADDRLGPGWLADQADGATVVFPLLHGTVGEDGTVQGMLEVAGLPYVGAGVLASAVCMDKSVAKEVLAFAGVPQTRWLSSPADRVAPGFLDEASSSLGYPMFVKPANLGSSIGITRVTERAGLDGAVALAGRYDEVVVLEAGVTAREIEVAVLGNAEPRASLPGEIVPPEGFYDYEEKYLNDRAKLQVPAPLSEAEVGAIQALALRAYSALRVEGMARVDLFYDEEGVLLVNEVNTIPGFTPISMYPKLWEASGLPPSRLLDELVALALERHRRRAARHVFR